MWKPGPTRIYRGNEFHPKLNLPVATKMAQMQNPKFLKTMKANFTYKRGFIIQTNGVRIGMTLTGPIITFLIYQGFFESVVKSEM